MGTEHRVMQPAARRSTAAGAGAGTGGPSASVARILQMQSAAGNQATSGLLGGGGSLLDRELPERHLEGERPAPAGAPAATGTQSWGSWLYENGYLLAGGAAVATIVGAGVYLYLQGSGGGGAGAAETAAGAGVPEMPAGDLADVARSALDAASPQQIVEAVEASSGLTWVEETVLEVTGDTLEHVVTKFAGQTAAIAAGTARSLAMGMDAAEALEANVPYDHFGLG